MSVEYRDDDNQEITGLLRDISGTEKNLRLVLLSVMMGAVGFSLYALWLR